MKPVATRFAGKCASRTTGSPFNDTLMRSSFAVISNVFRIPLCESGAHGLRSPAGRGRDPVNGAGLVQAATVYRLRVARGNEILSGFVDLDLDGVLVDLVEAAITDLGHADKYPGVRPDVKRLPVQPQNKVLESTARTDESERAVGLGGAAFDDVHTRQRLNHAVTEPVPLLERSIEQ